MKEKEYTPEALPQENSVRDNSGKKPFSRRPAGLSIILLFSFVYNGFLLLVLAAGMFFPEVVQNLLQQYYHHIYFSKFVSFLLTLAATTIFGSSFYGLILLWKNRRKGFYFYAATQAVVIFSLVFLLHSRDWINIAIACLVLLILWLFSRTMDK